MLGDFESAWKLNVYGATISKIVRVFRIDRLRAAWKSSPLPQGAVRLLALRGAGHFQTD
jgi:hypothetical protein